MKIVILLIPLFLIGCAHFSYENDDLVICLKKKSFISEICSKTTCYEYDGCDRLIRTYEK